LRLVGTRQLGDSRETAVETLLIAACGGDMFRICSIFLRHNQRPRPWRPLQWDL